MEIASGASPDLHFQLHSSRLLPLEARCWDAAAPVLLLLYTCSSVCNDPSLLSAQLHFPLPWPGRRAVSLMTGGAAFSLVLATLGPSWQ